MKWEQFFHGKLYLDQNPDFLLQMNQEPEIRFELLECLRLLLFVPNAII